jgi:hypothetical protein
LDSDKKIEQWVVADILNFLPDATLVIDCQGRVIAWNKAAEEMTGIKSEEILGKGDYEYSIPFYGYRRPLLVDHVLNYEQGWEDNYSYIEIKGQTIIGESLCRTKDNPQAYLWKIATPLYDIQGNINGAIESIRDNKADVMITGGAEASITPLGIGGFCAMKALSTANDDPSRACKPFDRKRDGFVMGEGAGVLVLEEMEHALERGATIHAELIGYGSSADACHMVQPDPDGKGAALAFRNALAQAGLEPQDIDYINAHGTGTTLNDQIETAVVKEVFASHSNNLPISSTKWAHGHMLGAAGAVELIATVMALIHDTIPPTMNLNDPDPLCDLDYVPNQPRQQALKVAISDSLGFGGHNAALIVRKLG